MKTSELTGAALDWAVAKCDEVDVRWSAPHAQLLIEDKPYTVWNPHKNWAQSGAIIEREKIGLEAWKSVSGWQAFNPSATLVYNGKTPLEAAMRCYVASKLGDEVEIPELLAV